MPNAREPDPRSRARAARDRRDDAWSPPRRSKGGVPGWVWAVGGSLLAVAAVIALGLALQRRARDREEARDQPDAGRLAAEGDGSERWVRRTHEASGATWEFPTTGESFPQSSIVRLADQKPLVFSVAVKDIPTREKSTPSLHPLTQLRSARPGGPSPFGTVNSTGTIDGRPSVVVRGPNSASLIAADYDRTYEFTVAPPDLDEGHRRIKRFFESVRITRPMPPEPAPPSTGVAAAGGEAIPPGWDRVQVPRTQLTLLMPKGPPPRRVNSVLAGISHVARGLDTPDGDEVSVYAAYIEATAVASGVGDPFGGVKERRTRVVGGYTARQEYRVLFGTHTVHEMIDLGAGGAKFFHIAISGEAVDFDSPEVKRVLDSVSFTLPAKVGPEAPENLTPPPWTRRFAAGGPATPAGGAFSVEMPGRSRSGVNLSLGPGQTWGSKGQIPLPGKKKMEFAALGVGIAVPGGPDPRKVIETEIEALGSPASKMKVVRRVEVGGRPGYIAARADKTGHGHVEMKVQDVVMAYKLVVAGPGVTPDTPEVKRFFESASFTIIPDAPAKSPADPPKK